MNSWLFSDLLGKGFFPRELPPTFSSRTLGNCADKFRRQPLPRGVLENSKKWTSYEIYNLARAGTLRRELAIVNPVSYWHLSKFISSNWRFLKRAVNLSPVSLTKPVQTNPNRALSRGSDIGELPYARARIRSTGKYVLQADISNFYGSIYTHSIAWALHGKAVAKRNIRNSNLLGNRFDSLLRSLQDGQTMGIPVGPDASLLFAEIVSGAIDRKIFPSKSKTGIRYIDDYEVAFDDEAEALKLRSSLQSELSQYRLLLNPTKTKIVRLPVSIDDGWTREIRNIISGKYQITRGLCVDYFDCAFRLVDTYPTGGVLKFAIGKLTKKWFTTDAIDLITSFLIQAARVEPGCLPFIAAILLRDRKSLEGNDNLQKCLASIIREHAPQRHSSEVAWALWMKLSCGFKVDLDLISLILSMEDSVCALLLIEMLKGTRLDKSPPIRKLKRALSAEDLYGPRWMLAYEAIRSGWLTSKTHQNYLTQDPNYNFFMQNSVQFFDSTKIGTIPSGLLPPDEPDDDAISESNIVIDADTRLGVADYSEGNFWDEWEELDDD